MEKEKKFYCRCGMCDKNFASSEEWGDHAETPEHKEKILMFEKGILEAKLTGGHVDIRDIVRKIQRKGKTVKPKPVIEQKSLIGSISDAYSFIELYEMGGLSQREFLVACKYALEHFREKYGKDSFWFREVFGHMQGDDWESTFKIRSLVHAEVIGVPHVSITECDKYKTKAELDIFKGKKCQHCRYVDGVKEKWEEKGV